MTRPRHPLVAERIVADVPLDARSALLAEQLNNGKVVVWVCGRAPDGRSIPATATRAYSIPLAALGAVAEALARIDSASQPNVPVRTA